MLGMGNLDMDLHKNKLYAMVTKTFKILIELLYRNFSLKIICHVENLSHYSFHGFFVIFSLF